MLKLSSDILVWVAENKPVDFQSSVIESFFERL